MGREGWSWQAETRLLHSSCRACEGTCSDFQHVNPDSTWSPLSFLRLHQMMGERGERSTLHGAQTKTESQETMQHLSHPNQTKRIRWLLLPWMEDEFGQDYSPCPKDLTSYLGWSSFPFKGTCAPFWHRGRDVLFLIGFSVILINLFSLCR